MRNKIETENKSIDALAASIEKCIEGEERNDINLTRKLITEAEIFLAEPSNANASFQSNSSEVLKWENTDTSKVLTSFLENEGTWDENARKQRIMELSIARDKMAEAKDAIDILLEVQDYDEAAIYQKEHDKYLLLAADCQRQLLLWYDPK